MREKKSIRMKIPVHGRNRYVISRDIYSYFHNTPDVMTVREAAKALRCSKNSLYTLIREGRLSVIKIGRCIKVPKSALVEFLVNEKNYFIILPQDFSHSGWTSPGSCGIVGGDKKRCADKKRSEKKKEA